MNSHWRPGDDEIEALFSGEQPEGSEDLATLLQDLRTTFARSPQQEVRDRHIAQISDVARDVASDSRPVVVGRGDVISARSIWRTVVGRTISFATKAAAGVAAASLSMIGLAYAGVDLPGQAAAKALEAVTSLDLPNQDPGSEQEGKSVSEDVQSVIDGTDPSDRGCEFGQSVSAAASQNSQAEDKGPEEDPCAQSDEDELETEDATDGRANAAEKSGGRSEAGADNATQGKATATEKSGGKSDAGASNAAEGKGTATEKSGGKSDAGASNAPEDDSDAGTDGKSKASESSGGRSDAGASNAPATDSETEE